MRVRKLEKRYSEKIVWQESVAAAETVESAWKERLRRWLENPDIYLRLIVIAVSLSADNTALNERLDKLMGGFQRARQISDIVSEAMDSVRIAAKVPEKIRQAWS